MRGAIEKDIIPRFGMLVDNMQQQKSRNNKSIKMFFDFCRPEF